MSNVYLNIKIRSLIHTTPFTTNYPWEISIVYLTMSNPIQSIIAKTCNSIIQTILLIIIILYTILCKIISFENYTCTYCGLFNHTIQHQYCPNLKKKNINIVGYLATQSNIWKCGLQKKTYIQMLLFWNFVLHACHKQARTIAIENELENISDMKSINCLVLDFLYI